MRSGISTACLYPMLLEESLASLISMDFKLFEIFMNTCSELRPRYLKQLKSKLEAAGASVKSIHPFTSGYEGFLLFSDYKRQYLDGLEFYKNYFQACNLLGAEILVLHGKRSSRRDRAEEEQYFERYSTLFELGRTYGVTVAQENVNLLLSNEIEFIRHMKKYCGENCAFVLDIKQAIRGGLDPFTLCGAMSDRIIHIHLNDNNATSDCLLPGAGSMDYGGFLKKLTGYGFSGDLIIEVYRKSFHKLEELLDAKNFVESLTTQYFAEGA